MKKLLAILLILTGSLIADKNGINKMCQQDSDCKKGLICSMANTLTGALTPECISPRNLNQVCMVSGSDCKKGLVCGYPEYKCIKPNSKGLKAECVDDTECQSGVCLGWGESARGNCIAKNSQDINKPCRFNNQCKIGLKCIGWKPGQLEPGKCKKS